MTDNIFDIDATALTHLASAPQESGILLTGFSAAFPSFNHASILSVIEKTDLPSGASCETFTTTG